MENNEPTIPDPWDNIPCAEDLDLILSGFCGAGQEDDTAVV